MTPGITNARRIADENRQRQQASKQPPAFDFSEPIVAVSVVNDHGAHWLRLAGEWAVNAALCSAQQTYAIPGADDRMLVRCRERVRWQAGEVGLCARCMARLLDVGQ